MIVEIKVKLDVVFDEVSCEDCAEATLENAKKDSYKVVINALASAEDNGFSHRFDNVNSTLLSVEVS